jgi:cell wall-associated NlpC family hydrolase
MGKHRPTTTDHPITVRELETSLLGEATLPAPGPSTASRLAVVAAGTLTAAAVASGAVTGEIPAASAQGQGGSGGQPATAPAVPAPAPAPAAEDGGVDYVVVRGDSLWKIGQAHGVDWRRIAEANGISAPWTIYPDQKLRVPATENTRSAPAPAPAAQAAPAAPAAPAPAPATGAAAKAVQAAMSQLGVRYVWGGESLAEGGYDCSGLMQYAYQAAGVSLPRTSKAQSGVGVSVSRADLQPGDLVFYYSPVSHVALYIGNGQVIQAPTSGDVVRVTSIDWAGQPVSYKRVA